MSDMTESRFRKLLAKKDRSLDEANELIDKMLGFIVQHGAAIIDLRAKMVDHKDAIEGIGNIVMPPEEDNSSKLIGIKPPKLELN